MTTTGAAQPGAGTQAVSTFLMTDIAGSTRLWETHPAAMPAVLDRVDHLLEGAVAGHGGRVIRSRGEGDSAFAAFTATSEAIAAAVELQRDFAAEPWPKGIELQVRMAIHTGETVHRFGDYFGSVVNRCARIRAAAHGGQILISNLAAELASDRLPAGVTFLDLGTHRLRDLRWPERVFQVCHPDLAAEFPPIVTVDRRRDNVPKPLTNFLGRDDELKRLADALAEQRLVTLTGPGGVGKTRLAIEAAAAIATRRGDERDVWFVDLTTVSAGSDPAPAVAETLAVPLDPTRPMTDSLVAYLESHAVLLVVDNCEHVVEPLGELVALLLDRCPDLNVLATSREVLNVTGEGVFPVHPLAVGAADTASVALFVDRAQLANPDFRPTTPDLEVIAEVCEAVDGLPLAVELAAARTRTLSVTDLAGRISGHLTLLTNRDRASAPRQRTIRALIEWSYDLLSPSEQLLFRRLSAFAGCVGLDHIADVCGDELDDDQLIDLLSALVDKSLVVHEGDGGCYRMLVTIRAFAADRLRAAGEADTVHARHWQHYWTAAAGGNAALFSDMVPALEALDAIHDECVLALERSIAAGDFDVVAGLESTLAEYWETRGRLPQVYPLLERAVDAAPDDTGKLHLLLTVLTRSCLRSNRPETEAVVRRAVAAARRAAAAQGDETLPRWALLMMGNVLATFGKADESMDARVEALELARQAGDDLAIVKCEANLGVTLMQRGETDEPRRLFEQSIQGAMRLGDLRMAAISQINLGQILDRVGQTSACVESMEAAIELCRQLGDRRLEAAALSNLGITLTNAGRYDDAEDALRRGLELSRAVEMKTDEANFEAALGNLFHYWLQPAKAEEHLRRAIAMCEGLGERPRVAWHLQVLAVVKASSGDIEEAIALHEQSIPIARALGDRRLLTYNHMNLAARFLDLGRYEEAETSALEAAELADSLGDPIGLCGSLLHAGRAALGMGRADVAVERLRSCIERTSHLRISEQAQAHVELAGLAATARDYGGARTELLAALDVLDGINRLDTATDVIGTCALHLFVTGRGDESRGLAGWALARATTPRQGWASELPELWDGIDPPEPQPELDQYAAIATARALLLDSAP